MNPLKVMRKVQRLTFEDGTNNKDTSAEHLNRKAEGEDIV